MKVVIIGAGIAGLFAAGAFEKDGHDVTILESRNAADYSVIHKALFRVRDLSLCDYIKCDSKKIIAQKAIWCNGRMYNQPDIRMNNMYSMKTYGALGSRSLMVLGDVERYLISNVETTHLNLVCGYRVENNSDPVIHRSDIVISTIPIMNMMRIVGYNKYPDLKIKSNHIYITIVELSIDSDVHQTIYFPSDFDTVAYRATIEGGKMIIESMSDSMTAGNVGKIMAAFGLHISCMVDYAFYTQPYGKIIPIDDRIRRRIIVDLTNQHKIYSFGRHAVWKPLRVDDLKKDMERLKHIISVGNDGYYK